MTQYFLTECLTYFHHFEINACNSSDLNLSFVMLYKMFARLHDENGVNYNLLVFKKFT